MKLVYISGPYRSANGPNGIYENIQRARQAALKFWQAGYAVICPHLNTAFMDGAAHDTVWLEGDLEILRRCDIIYMLNGWENSEGAKRELDEAADNGKEIVYEDSALIEP